MAKREVEEAKREVEEAKKEADEAKREAEEVKIPELIDNKEDFKKCIDIELTYLANLEKTLSKGGRSIKGISPYKTLLKKFKTTLDQLTPNNNEVLNLVEDLNNLKSKRIHIDTLHTGDYKPHPILPSPTTLPAPKKITQKEYIFYFFLI